MPNLLEFIGWGRIDKRLIDVINKNKKVIVLFPHTSGVSDPFIMFTHMSLSSEFESIRDKIRILVRGNNYHNPIWGPALKYFGGLPATHPDIKNGGSTEYISNELSKMKDGFILMISPKGKIDKCELDDWKTGWYYLALEYDATIVVAGPDFEKHRILMAGDPMKIEGRSIEEMKKIIKPLYGYIVPLNPSRSEVKVRNHVNRSLFDPGTGQSFILITLLVLISSIVIIFGLVPSKYEASTTSLTKGTTSTLASLDLT